VAATQTQGRIKVFVSGGKDSPKQPSEFNNGPGGATCPSDEPPCKAADDYKLLTFSRPGETFHKIYISVLNDLSATKCTDNGDCGAGSTCDKDKNKCTHVQAKFNILVYLDLFVQGEHKQKLDPEKLQPGTVISSPVIKPKTTQGKAVDTDMGNYKIELHTPDDPELKTAVRYDAATKKVVLTDKAAALAKKNGGALTGTIELRAFHNTLGSLAKDPGCLNGLMRIILTATQETFKADWDFAPPYKGNYGLDLEFEEYSKAGPLITSRRQRRAAKLDDPLFTITAACAKDPENDANCKIEQYAITSGNQEGLFKIDEKTGAVSVVDNDKFDFEDRTRHELEITAYNNVLLKGGVRQKSDPAGKTTIALQNERERPTLVYDGVIAPEEGAGGFTDTVLAKVPILNPEARTRGSNKVEWTDLTCRVAAAPGAQQFETRIYTEDGENYFCLLKPSVKDMDLSAEGTATVTLDVLWKNVATPQDTKTVEIAWGAGGKPDACPLTNACKELNNCCGGKGECKVDNTTKVASCQNCEFPFYGETCEKESEDPCKKEAGALNCINGGECTPTKAPDDVTADSGPWSDSVCICKSSDGACFHGKTCDQKISCGEIKTVACARFVAKARSDKPKFEEICLSEACEPSFANKFCLAGAIPKKEKSGGGNTATTANPDTATEDDDLIEPGGDAIATTTVPELGAGDDDDVAGAEAAKQEGDDGDDDTAMIIIIIVVLLLCLCCCIAFMLFMMKKKRDDEAVARSLSMARASRKQQDSRGAQPAPPPQAQGADPGMYEAIDEKGGPGAAPVANPMYGMGGGGGGDQGGLYDMSSAGNTGAAASVNNPMYGMGGGGGAGLYDQAATAQGGGYRDVAPNQPQQGHGGAMNNGSYLKIGDAPEPISNPTYGMGDEPQGGYRDVAPNQPAPQGGYRDIAPNANPKHDTYIEQVKKGQHTYDSVANESSTDGQALYDDAGAVNQSPYDMSANTTYDTAAVNTPQVQSPYDMAAQPSTQSPYDMAQN